jgi:hypothetical protein
VGSTVGDTFQDRPQPLWPQLICDYSGGGGGLENIKTSHLFVKSFYTLLIELLTADNIFNIA